jgi:hypothetical protein
LDAKRFQTEKKVFHNGRDGNESILLAEEDVLVSYEHILKNMNLYVPVERRFEWKRKEHTTNIKRNI